MKYVIVSFVSAALLFPASAAQAAPPDPKPQVRIVSVEPTGSGSEGTTDYRITVEAADPDGIVSELALDFGDGAMVWLLLACTAPGEASLFELDWSYAPGKYQIRAWVYSTTECFGGDVQESRIDRARLKVA